MTTGQGVLEQVEREPAEGRVQLRELAVEADVSAVVIVLEPVGPQERESLGVGRVAKGDEAAFAAGHDLGAAQAERRGVAERPQRRTPITPAQPMSCVEDQLQPVLARQAFERLDGRGQAEDMDRRDADRPRGDQPPDVLDVDAIGLRIHIGEDRLEPVPAQGVDRRAEGEARDNHLARRAFQGLPRQRQPDVATGDAERRRDDRARPEARVFEQPCVLAEVGQHPRLEQLGDELGELVQRWQMGTHDRDRGGRMDSHAVSSLSGPTSRWRPCALRKSNPVGPPG